VQQASQPSMIASMERPVQLESTRGFHRGPWVWIVTWAGVSPLQAAPEVSTADLIQVRRLDGQWRRPTDVVTGTERPQAVAGSYCHEYVPPIDLAEDRPTDQIMLLGEAGDDGP
jgi:hypothetical protein